MPDMGSFMRNDLGIVRNFAPGARLAALATLLWPAPAFAAEFCVSCSAPEASYRCEVAGGGAAWLRCITELAREGGHESCTVDRKLVPPCPGLLRVLEAPPEGGAPSDGLPIHAAIPEPDHGQRPLPPPLDRPGEPLPAEGGAEGDAPPKRVPQTMKELASDTYEASKEGFKKAGDAVSESAKKAGDAVTGTARSAGEGLSKAGSAVGDAAKKTWNCLTSLFQEC
jgi:hypothetical protein